MLISITHDEYMKIKTSVTNRCVEYERKFKTTNSTIYEVLYEQYKDLAAKLDHAPDVTDQIRKLIADLK